MKRKWQRKIEIRKIGFNSPANNIRINMKPRIMQPTSDYTTVYHEAEKAADTQLDIFWHPNEIAVEKDIQDMRVNLTESEYHGVMTVLKLFTLYELMAGAEYWGDRVMKEFPRPDIQRMASAFSFFELNVHAPFYNKINKLLGLASTEFYTDYVDDPVLKDRMEFVDEYINHDDILTSLGVFTMVEGVVLYSSFAFLKHFQNNGKNKIRTINSGISFSVRDEALHQKGGAWLFRTAREELNLTDEEYSVVVDNVVNGAKKAVEHEFRIVDMIFEKGQIKGITAHQLKNFIMSRADECLKDLGIDAIYKPDYNPIADWFYGSINGGQFNDLFVSQGSEYNRDWVESDFGLAWEV